MQPLANADPRWDYPRPDVEALIWRAVKPLGGVVTWAYSASEVDLPGWLVTVNVQVDVRAARKGEAYRRADRIRRVINALPWGEWPDGVISRVDTTEGPFWLPDADGKPRYVARYAVTVHPRPGLIESEERE